MLVHMLNYVFDGHAMYLGVCFLLLRASFVSGIPLSALHLRSP